MLWKLYLLAALAFSGFMFWVTFPWSNPVLAYSSLAVLLLGLAGALFASLAEIRQWLR